MPSRVVVSGATGFIGRRLLDALEDQETTALAREPARARAALPPSTRVEAWTPGSGPAPLEALRGRDLVVHLAGEPVAEGRWTAARRARIRDSRVHGTRGLVLALAALPPEERPRTLLAASAVGVYGSRGDEILPEEAAPGEGFLADVCRAWEAEARAAEVLGLRVVLLRIGIVLGPGGGALARMAPLFRRGLGGRLTWSGAQWVPWIHIDDVVGLILHAARTDALRGPLNVVAPTPVRNRDLTRALARDAGRAAPFAVPGLALRLAVGGMADVLTASQRCAPEAALAHGYTFRHPELEGALAAIRREQEGAAWPSTASSASR